jgi:putative transposase
VARARELALLNPELSLEDFTRLFARTEGVELRAATMRKYLVAAGLRRSRPPRGPGESPVEESTASAADAFRYTEAHRDEGDADRYPHGLTDAEWALVQDIFQQKGPGRPPKHSRRAVLDACIYVVRSGCPWRMLPKDLSPWQAVYGQFRRWTEAGVFEQMHDRLRGMWREREHRAIEPTGAIIDAQAVKTSAQGGPKGFDAGKKIKGRKRHLVTDTLGLILAVMITGANVQDRDAAEPVVAAAMEKYPTLKHGWADGGYGGKTLDAIRANYGLDVEVVRHPANRNVGRWHDPQQIDLPGMAVVRGFAVLPRRWVIERTNGWTDLCRRLQRDHDRRLDVSTGWVWFAHARLLLHRVAGAGAATEAAVAHA